MIYAPPVRTWARKGLLSLLLAAGVLAPGAGCDKPKPPPPASATQPANAPEPASVQPPAVHPLLGQAGQVVQSADQAFASTANPDQEQFLRAAQQAAGKGRPPAGVTVDYPLAGTIFPPEIVPPTILWHDGDPLADTWQIEIAFSEGPPLRVLSSGPGAPADPVDPACVTATNRHVPTAQEASARSWTPEAAAWEQIKKRSARGPATVTIAGLSSGEPGRLRSGGRTTFTTSKDPVGAPIFYRDVPLMPSETVEGQIQPLSHDAMPMIAWRLRDISKPDSRIVLQDMPTCANCHSFSADGKTLAMDIDGPTGDKGVYTLAAIGAKMIIEDKDLITWNSFSGKPAGTSTIGFLSQVSPDGRHAVTTLNESLYVRNFLDYRFLQVFYPTRGVLGWYSRATGQIRLLSGADDPAYVHCDPAWSPDGRTLVFARAGAQDPYTPESKVASQANDPRERQIRYDLYRLDFNDGAGGKPTPLLGASGNGMSNTFPKVSPDGKWVVFVQCANGQLMRPDGKLWIVPAGGGQPRLMTCNTPLMNSWHTFSPNGRWMAFSSKGRRPYTQLFLTHIDENGADSPAVLLPNCTAANRAVNIPEFVNIAYDDLQSIDVPAVQYRRELRQGADLLEQRKFPQAQAMFQTVLKRSPNQFKAHLGLALAMMEQGRYAEALPRLDRALQCDAADITPGSRAIVHDCLGKALANTNRPAEAIEHFRKALSFNETLDHACYNWGAALLAMGKPQEALGKFQDALKRNSHYTSAYVGMGHALAAMKRPDEAADQYRKALSVSPNSVDARVALGQLLLGQGKAREALVPLGQAVDMRPQAPELRFLQALALHADKQYAAEIQTYRKTLEQLGENPQFLNALAWSLATSPDESLRDGPQAVRLAQRACQVTNNASPALLDTLAAAFAQAGDFEQAVLTAQKALSNPGNTDQATLETLRIRLEEYKARAAQQKR